MARPTRSRGAVARIHSESYRVKIGARRSASPVGHKRCSFQSEDLRHHFDQRTLELANLGPAGAPHAPDEQVQEAAESFVIVRFASDAEQPNYTYGIYSRLKLIVFADVRLDRIASVGGKKIALPVGKVVHAIVLEDKIDKPLEIAAVDEPLTIRCGLQQPMRALGNRINEFHLPHIATFIKRTNPASFRGCNSRSQRVENDFGSALEPPRVGHLVPAHRIGEKPFDRFLRAPGANVLHRQERIQVEFFDNLMEENPDSTTAL